MLLIVAILFAFTPYYVGGDGDNQGGCSTVRVSGFKHNSHLDGKYKVESKGCGSHLYQQRAVYTKSHQDDDSDNGGKSSHEHDREMQQVAGGSQTVQGVDDTVLQGGGHSSEDQTPDKPSEKLFLFFNTTGNGWHISARSCNLSGAVARVIDEAWSPDAVQTTWQERTQTQSWVDVQSTNVKCETDESGDSDVVAIVLGVFVGLVVLLLIILLVTYCVKKKRVNPVAVYGYDNKSPVNKEISQPGATQKSAVVQATTGPASDVPPYEATATAPPAYAEVLRYPQPPDYSASSNVKY